MKKTIICMVVLFGLLSVGNSRADLLNPTDQVYIKNLGTPYGGGPFELYKNYSGSTGYADYITSIFCLERAEFFTPPGPLTISSISYDVLNGGSNNPNAMRLTYEAAYVFNEWLNDGSPTGNTAASYQLAIWYFENELIRYPDLTNDYSNNQAAKDLVAEALGQHLTDYIAGIRVINFDKNGTIQSMIYKEPVPEPVSMLLFGTGLAGVGGYLRRRFKK